jgi:hypothetical protein
MYIFCFGPAIGIGAAIGLWLFLAIMDFNSMVVRGFDFLIHMRKSGK